MTVGTHYIIDAYLKSDKLIKLADDNFNLFNEYILDKLKKNDMNVINYSIKNFENPPGSFTALYLLSESHLSFHSFPELNYIAIDCFTCGKCNTQNLVNDIMNYLEPIKYLSNKIDRNSNNLIGKQISVI